MKRSEMIEFLSKRIEDFGIGGKDSKLSFNECAETLLTELESKGMLPPSKKVDYLEHKAIQSHASDIFTAYHKWDTEDATKADSKDS